MGYQTDWVDAFASEPLAGNGCAVVHDAGNLSDEICIKFVRETSLSECTFVEPSKKIGYFFWKKIDVSIIDKFGPDGLSQLIKYLSLKAVKFQSGYIYQYAFVMLIGFSILLTLLLVN